MGRKKGQIELTRPKHPSTNIYINGKAGGMPIRKIGVL
jgi:hypothetical protein